MQQVCRLKVVTLFSLLFLLISQQGQAAGLFGGWFNVTHGILKSNSYLQGSGLDTVDEKLCGLQVDRETKEVRFFFRALVLESTFAWAAFKRQRGYSEEYLISTEDEQGYSLAMRLQRYNIKDVSVFKNGELIRNCQFVVFP